MRITGGKARGIKLDAPRDRQTRPATDRSREALFSSLGELSPETRFLDLFAGTGSYGLEAWSRGSRGGVFVEKNRSLIPYLKANIERVGKSTGTSPSGILVVQRDVFKWHTSDCKPFDLVFCDPPYDRLKDWAEPLFALMGQLLSPPGRIVLEQPADLQICPPGFERVKRLGGKRPRSPSQTIWKKTH